MGEEKRREQMVTEMPWATWNDFNKEEDAGMWWSDYLAASSIKIQHFFFLVGLSFEFMKLVVIWDELMNNHQISIN